MEEFFFFSGREEVTNPRGVQASLGLVSRVTVS